MGHFILLQVLMNYSCLLFAACVPFCLISILKLKKNHSSDVVAWSKMPALIWRLPRWPGANILSIIDCKDRFFFDTWGKETTVSGSLSLKSHTQALARGLPELYTNYIYGCTFAFFLGKEYLNTTKFSVVYNILKIKNPWKKVSMTDSSYFTLQKRECDYKSPATSVLPNEAKFAERITIYVVFENKKIKVCLLKKVRYCQRQWSLNKPLVPGWLPCAAPRDKCWSWEPCGLQPCLQCPCTVSALSPSFLYKKNLLF